MSEPHTSPNIMKADSAHKICFEVNAGNDVAFHDLIFLNDCGCVAEDCFTTFFFLLANHKA